MKNSFLGKKKKMSADTSLQITSMADIFMILLVFLLKSYASGSIEITPSPGIQLPTGKTEDVTNDALKIEIAEGSVLVESKPVAEIEKFAFKNSDLLENGVSKALSKALEIARKRQGLISQANADVKADARVIVLADQRAPYATIKTVLASAAVNGYTDFKLAVINENQ
jgi:biopolymer transport protein ExbD